LVLVLLFFPLAVLGDALVGIVAKIPDGDTVHVLDAQRQTHKVRLAGMDAPERMQPLGTRSKQRLVKLIGGERVAVDWHKHDRWGRRRENPARGDEREPDHGAG
jgi:endonuclease YncB( thermonuclease family)